MDPPAFFLCYTRLNQIVDKHDFDGYVEGLRRRFYADEGRPGRAPNGVAPAACVAVSRPRFYTSMLAVFASVALALAAFGVMNYAVSQRLREISIRMALSAHAGTVLRMIVGQALMLAATGGVVGIVAALALGRAIRNQLFGVTVFDPMTIGGVTTVLALSATVASLLPAWRAATTDPVGVLRN